MTETLCAQCGERPPRPGRKKCGPCLNAAWYRRRAGRCPRHNHVLGPDGCPECRRENRLRAKRNYRSQKEFAVKQRRCLRCASDLDNPKNNAGHPWLCILHVSWRQARLSGKEALKRHRHQEIERLTSSTQTAATEPQKGT